MILFLGFCGFGVAAQQKIVSGNISSTDEGPLPGVNIVIQGTGSGTVSDTEGNYTISVPDQDAILVFSSIGYVSDTMAIGNQSIVNVLLDPDVQFLSEVIVTGYTTQSKKDITGAVSSVSNDKLVEVPAATFTQQLQGRVTGVVVGQDNSPGGEPLVRIRGWGTINDNDPLYIIDGVPTKYDLQAINASNVEELTILKDASAASIYGSRAANGVVIITTKKGNPGKPKVTLDARVGIQMPINGPDMLNTQEKGEFLYQQQHNHYLATNGNDNGFEFINEQYGSDPNDGDFIPDYVWPIGAYEGDSATVPEDYSLDPYNGITRANKQGTNWYDEKFDPASIQEYNIGVNGGTESSRYFVSFNYFNQQGVLNPTYYERFTLRTNTSFTPKSWLRIGENLEVSFSNAVGTFNNGVIADLSGIGNDPIFPVYDINGYFARGANAVSGLQRNRDNTQERWRIFGGAFIEADIIQDLTFKSQIGLDYRNYYFSFFIEDGLEQFQQTGDHELRVASDDNFTWTWWNTLRFTRTFHHMHRIGILVGTEAIDQRYRDLSATRTGFYSADVNYRYLSAGALVVTNGGTGSESSLFSLFGKVNYAFRDKYLLDITVRRDGSSRFSESNQYATFPAFSLGWRVGKEPFVSGVDWITDLKLRVSWGKMGNQEISNYNQYYTYRSSIEESAYDIGGTDNSVQPGFDSERFGNPEGIWETTTTFDVGFDWTLWNKLTVNFDWYHMRTTDMLYRLRLPGTRGGAEFPYQNVGEMQNKGVDLGLNWKGSSPGGDFHHDITLNISHYKNQIIKLGDNKEEGFFGAGGSWTRNQAGVPFNSFYGLIIDGFTDGTESPEMFQGYYGYGDGKGRFKYRDIDEDGKITDNDRTFIGNPHPDFTYGLSYHIYYRHFDFGLFVQGSQGNDIINFFSGRLNFSSTKEALYESWTADLGDKATLPLLSTADGVSSERPSTYFIEDGSYLRLKNLQIGYTFPDIKGISRLRIYIQTLNLFTITGYSGLDPEINRSGRPITSGTSGIPGSASVINGGNLGLDYGYYPISRQYLVGLNFEF